MAQLHTNPAGSLMGLVTMRWVFFFTPSYTKVLSLVVSKAPVGALVQIACHSKGCSFTDSAATVICGRKGKQHCAQLHGAVDITRHLFSHRLRVGVSFSVEVYLPGWVSKYYVFTIRSGQGPRVRITCVAPGLLQPGVGCQARIRR
jgi:hypothetical protein